MINKVILIGNLGRDPELRNTQSGTSVCNLRLAVTERQKDREGNWGDHTEWLDVVAWGKTADNVARFQRKGSRIYVEGRLKTREWEKDGVKRYSTEVHAFTIQFLDRKSDNAGSGGGGYGGNSSGSGGGYGGGGNSGGGSGYGGGGGSDSSIPF